MTDDEIEIETCASPHDLLIGAHVGIRIRHGKFGIIVKCVECETQFKNKRKGIEKLKLELVKERIFNIDESKL